VNMLESMPFAAVGVISAIYAVGVDKLWRQGRGRGVAVRRVVSFYAGLAAVVVALASPLDELAATWFSFHMIQHLVLVLVAPPLLVYGSPLTPVTLALPQRTRRQLHRWGRSGLASKATTTVRNPVTSGILLAAALWAWHLPKLYKGAVLDAALHGLEHASFLGAALLFWGVVIGAARRPRSDYGPAMLLVFVTGLQSAALAAILIFSSVVLYPVHDGGGAWRISPLEDQQLAGAIMWTPMGLVLLATVITLLARWLRSLDARMERSPVGAQADPMEWSE
jgi:putative membrane protein